MDTTNANFSGRAIVELFGHQREIGYVTTQVFGQACLFRIDVPEISEREYQLERREWIGDVLAGVGSTVKRPGSPGRTRLVGPSAIYALNPCTEDVARAAIEKMFPAPLKLIEAVNSVKDQRSLPVPSADDDVDKDEIL